MTDKFNDTHVNNDANVPTRYISALMVRVVVDFAQMAIHQLDLDIDEFMIICCVVRESTRGIVEEIYLSREYGFEDNVLPMVERAPASLKSISTSLRISRETARRKLIKIVEKGILIKVEGGYVFPEQTGETDLTLNMRNYVANNADNFIQNINKLRNA